MITNQELIRKVRDYFSLNIYETKVWLALISRGIASAGEIAQISGVPRSRTYDVLESLEKQGFAITKIGKPVKYIAVKPTVIIENLKSKALSQANEKIDTLSSLKETKEYAELDSLFKKGIEPVKHTDLSGIVKGKSNIAVYLKELLENAEKEVSICMPVTEVESKSKLFSFLFEKLKEKKIKTNLALNGDEKQIKKLAEKYNIKAKKTDLNSKFFIIDRKNFLFMLTNSEEGKDELAMWISSDFFVNSLATMFNSSFK